MPLALCLLGEVEAARLETISPAKCLVLPLTDGFNLMPDPDSGATQSAKTHADSTHAEKPPVDQLTPAEQRNLKIGLRLFAVYTAFYASFVLVNAFAASWSDWRPFGGLNLAVLWGFALILLAFVLAAVYGRVCRESGQKNTGQPASNLEETEA